MNAPVANAPVSGAEPAPVWPANAPIPSPKPVPALAERYLNIEDLRLGAKRKLPRGVFEFIDRGSEDEATLRDNRASFHRIKLRNKVLVDVSVRSQQTMLFGKPMSMPLAIAPTGAAGLAWYEGELELARAAARSGVPFTLATPSLTAIERIATVEEGRKWFQLYMWRDRELSHALVKRARDAGFETLILTGDTPVPPIREYNKKNGFNSPFSYNPTIVADVAMSPGWMWRVLRPYLQNGGMPKQAHYPSDSKGVQVRMVGGAETLRGDNLCWDDIARLREIWKGPILVKGVHLPEDAERGLKEGIDGVIISNHGGRNLDTAVASLDVLPDIVSAVGDKMVVIADSGIRRGGDILKLLAMGAHAVLSGRPTLYGTAVAGEDGAAHALALLKRELDTAMAYTGATKISEITPRCLWTAPK
jgi:(S)-mandelate dehydrogenase